jgi:predicted DCC family thiol-disulfide oxidoreductase YuxK
MSNLINDTLASKIILFDGVCVLCNYWAQFIIKHDTQKLFRLASVQSPVGQALLKYYGMPTPTFDTLLYIEGFTPENLASINNSEPIISTDDPELLLSETPLSGKLFIKTAAIFKILAQLGLPWRLFTIFKIIPASLSDLIYILIARNRYKIFGKNERCNLPTADHASRYFSDQ